MMMRFQTETRERSARMGVIGEFFAWWLRELAEMSPWAARRDRGAQGGRVASVVFVANTARIVAPNGAATDVPLDGGAAQIAQLLRKPPLRGASLRALLPAHSALARPCQYPAAARGRLDQILALDLDRNSPLKPGEAAFGYRILSERDGRLEIDQRIVKRSILAELREKAARLGLELDAIGLEDAPEINFLSQEAEGSPRGGSGVLARVNLALAALALALAAAWGAVEYGRGAAQLEGLQSRISALAPLAAEVAASRRAQSELEAKMGAFRASVTRPTMLSLLDELARRLPDDAYLTDVSLERGELRVGGLSANAAPLLRQLDGAEAWTDAAFAAPVTQDGRSGLQQFAITLRLRESGAATPDEQAAARGEDER